MLSICVFPEAHAADMVPEYLHGNWVIGTTEQKCGDSDTEYFIFRQNGTFEAGRSNKAEAVGFWEIDGNILNLDFISSPRFFQDIRAEIKNFGDMLEFKVKLVPFNVEKDRFEAVGVLGEQLNKGIAIRCR
jgi:hypothetical protein